MFISCGLFFSITIWNRFSHCFLHTFTFARSDSSWIASSLSSSPPWQGFSPHHSTAISLPPSLHCEAFSSSHRFLSHWALFFIFDGCLHLLFFSLSLRMTSSSSCSSRSHRLQRPFELWYHVVILALWLGLFTHAWPALVLLCFVLSVSLLVFHHHNTSTHFSLYSLTHVCLCCCRERRE